MRDLWDDEELFDALKEALRAGQSIPPEFIQAGRNAYAWNNIDAELAQLTFDSAHDSVIASVRSKLVSDRALTFTSSQLTIELEVGDGCLHGQVIPMRPGAIEIQAHTGTVATSLVDDFGTFRIQPIPAKSFRLTCRIPDGTDVQTHWITF